MERDFLHEYFSQEWGNERHAAPSQEWGTEHHAAPSQDLGNERHAAPSQELGNEYCTVHSQEWGNERHAAPLFSAAVIEKIRENRRKEVLFNALCIAIATVCVAALLLLVYPGYEQIFSMDFSVDFSAVVGRVWEQTRFLFETLLPDYSFMLGLPTYLVLLTVALLGIDRFVRNHLQAD